MFEHFHATPFTKLILTLSLVEIKNLRRFTWEVDTDELKENLQDFQRQNSPD